LLSPVTTTTNVDFTCNCSTPIEYHWVVITFDGLKVRLYDSLPKERSKDISIEDPDIPDSFQLQLASIVAPSDGEITVNHMLCSIQPDKTSCGLYALANLFELYLSSTTDNNQNFVLKSMRKHIAGTLLTGKITAFPKRSKRGVTRDKETVLKASTITTYCFCNMPQCFDLRMIQCASCNVWFHPKCLGHPKAALVGDIELSFQDIPGWVCRVCGAKAGPDTPTRQTNRKK
jgi:hypothetical protein